MSSDTPMCATDDELRWLSVRHDTRYAYDAPVVIAHHMAYLRPRDTAMQRVRGWRLRIDPPADANQVPAEMLSHQSTRHVDSLPVGMAASTLIGEATGLAEETLVMPVRRVFESQDSWGNWRHSFSHTRVHERLQVSSTFEVGVSRGPDLDPAGSPPWETVAEDLVYRAGAARSEPIEFTLPSRFAPRDAALAAFARQAFTRGRPLLEAALALCSLIYRDFKYAPASTSVGTGALQALKLRRGVCQDFAHVMIGALRSIGLAARYVSGYLLTNPPPGQPRLIGADASHAWVMVWCPVHGWVALDPTNDVIVRDDHVTLSWGRDYADVAPLRGVIRGGDAASPHVAVTVAPIDEELGDPTAATTEDGQAEDEADEDDESPGR